MRRGRASNRTVNLAPIALDVMTKWLDAMAADPAPLTPAKVVKNKPADAVDAYWTPDGKRVNEVASWDPEHVLEQDLSRSISSRA